jgi:hypothetical protein
VRNDLHGSILREFRARNIPISLTPQMEVLLREAGKPPVAEAPAASDTN